MNRTRVPIGFSVDSDSEIEEVIISQPDINVDEVKDLINMVIDSRRLTVGERCEGEITITDDEIKIDYKYCLELGEDWGDDVWEYETITIRNF